MRSKIWTALTVAASAMVLLSGCASKISTSHATNFVIGPFNIPHHSVRINNHLDDGDASRSLFGSGLTFQEKQEALEKRMREEAFVSRVTAVGTIVYAVKNIPKGSVFRSDQLAEKEIEQIKIPEDAASRASLVVGRRAKYDVMTGQIVNQHDLAASKRRAG